MNLPVLDVIKDWLAASAVMVSVVLAGYAAAVGWRRVKRRRRNR